MLKYLAKTVKGLSSTELKGLVSKYPLTLDDLDLRCFLSACRVPHAEAVALVLRGGGQQLQGIESLFKMGQLL